MFLFTFNDGRTKRSFSLQNFKIFSIGEGEIGNNRRDSLKTCAYFDVTVRKKTNIHERPPR